MPRNYFHKLIYERRFNMTKETLKDKITRLENEIKAYKLQINDYKALVERLNQEISDMVDNRYEEFQGSATYKQ